MACADMSALTLFALHGRRLPSATAGIGPRSAKRRWVTAFAWTTVMSILLAATGARAETYKWVDERGRVQYTDRLPPESANRGSVELSKQGMTKKVVDPPLTETQQE